MTCYIIYPHGDRAKLKVLELSWSRSHETHEYAIASRKEFNDRDEATTYCKSLAKDNGLAFVASKPEDDYLD